MDIIHFALAIFVAPAMMAIFFLLVRNDLKETFNNQDLKFRVTMRTNRSLG